VTASREPEFFVGYSDAVGRRTRRFTLAVACVVLALAGGLGLWLGRSVDDPGAGAYGDEVRLEGVLKMQPYPVLRLSTGRAVLLSGDGKYGVAGQPEARDGAAVSAGGFMLKRGALDMLVVADGGLRAAAVAMQPTAPVARGRWRVSGEICDGKCYAGAMRPGQGLAHKACANLCVAGGVPPVLVTSLPVEGRNFLLLADAAGRTVPPVALDLAARPVVLEGEVEQLDDLLVFRVDWDKAQLE
jgi:hypothetical protein